MSGSGSPTGLVTGGDDLAVTVVAAQWHELITTALVDGARRGLQTAGVERVTLMRVSGAFELPVASLHAARAGADAVVALGVVIRGGTPHFDYVCQAATTGLTDVALLTGVPVGFGVLTCDTEEQAIDRAGLSGSSEDKGFEAAQAAVATALMLRG